MVDFIDLQDQCLTESDREVVERLRRRGARSLHDQAILASESLGERVITSQPVQVYEVPSVARKILAVPLVAELESILLTIREVNEEVVGMRVSRARVLLDGEERVYLTKDRLRAWAERYTSARLAKANLKDRDDPMLRFRRILAELLPGLETLGELEGTVNSYFLHDFLGYVPWLLYQGTWSKSVEIFRMRGVACAQCRVSMKNPRNRAYALALIDLHSWRAALDLKTLVNALPSVPGQGTVGQLDLAGMRLRLRLLAEAIREMRPILIRNFNSERFVVSLGTGVSGSWRWAVGKGIGFVPVAESPEVILAQHRLDAYGQLFVVRHDGVLCVAELPWLNTAALADSQPEALEVNLRILEAIHDALFGFYDKIDLERLLSRWRTGRPRSVEDEDVPTEEEVAASCQIIAEDPPTGEATTTRSPGRRPRVKMVRSQQLCSILANRLGCDVRPGKGSEIVVYRPGGHHFRLGRHKNNDYVPSVVIQNLLSRVGIGFDEWLRAVA